ncbi:MAG: phage portal protein [Actinomycetota bacterium]
MAGSITIYSDGLPVVVSDRTYSLTSTGEAVHADAYKALGAGAGDPFELYRCQPSLRTVVGFLARNIAQVTLLGLRFDENGTRTRVERSDPLARLLRKPDRTQTAVEFMKALVTDMCLFDRFAAQIFREEDGSYRLVRIPPALWWFERGPTGRPNRIAARRADSTEYSVSLDRAFWMDGFPSDAETSPIESLRGILAEQQQSASYRQDMWNNAGRFPGWIWRPLEAPKWTSDGRDNFKAGWQKFASGGAKAGHTPVLEDGMKYEDVEGVTPEQAQQLESRKFSIAEVMAAYYVHPQLLGLLEGNYSNVTAFRQILYGDTLGSWFEDIEQAFNCRAIPVITNGDDDTFVEFDVNEKLRQTFEEQVKILTSAAGAPILTRNEARARINQPPVEGGDELIVPLNVLEGGQTSPNDTGTQNEGESE